MNERLLILSKLQRLQSLFPERASFYSETLWRIAGDLKDSEGLRWVREELATYDWSRCRGISVQRWKGRVDRKRGTMVRFEGECSPPSEFYLEGGKIKRRGYHISNRLVYQFSFPEVVRSGAELQNENEVLVWLIAHEAAHYLLATEQIPGEDSEEECDVFADERLREYRVFQSS
jgi:hypothetical protein